MIKRILLLPLIACMALTVSWGQTVLEDFENGANLPWNADFGDSTVTVVANPDSLDFLGINPSDSAGSYTKVAGTGFSLLIAVLDDPIDMSTNNRFTIQVNSPVASSFIMKLEGGGNAIEQTKNIAVTNSWIEYTFDFSDAADIQTLDRIILFFDPGNAESSDTYLFDNLVARPANECSGVAADPAIVDDFECQRNVQIGSPGYLDVTTIANPDPSGINTSAQVGRYNDAAGGSFHALVYDFGSDIPLTERGQVNIKIWAPTTGRLLVKLEGGSSTPIERDAQVTETESWQEYSIDFSDQAGASHEKLVFFFNAGVEPDSNDIYFIDDITFSMAPTGSVLEDFESGAQLGWASLGATDVFGSFDGAIPNPDQASGNDSETVGSYTKGSSQFGGLEAQLPGDFTLEQFPQLNLQVWAPANTSAITMRLFSPAEGLKEITQDLPANEAWVDLTFNFVDFQSVTDFERVELIFDENVAASGTWYFDNLTQGEGTTDPCEGVVAIPQIFDDFDCQRNVPITVGGDRLQVIGNPDGSGVNPDPLDKVGEYSDPNDPWSALVYEMDGPIDLSIYNQLSVRLWSPDAVPMLFKLEGGTTGPVEVSADITTTGEWVEYVIDFSSAAGSDNNRLAIFFNAGQMAGEEVTYYIDDIAFGRAPYTACVSDFETAATSVTNWMYFENGSFQDSEFPVIDNPDISDGNMSQRVGVFREAADGTQPFAGAFARLENIISFPDPMNKTIRMKVWSDQAAPIVMKLEGSNNGAPGSGDVFADYTTPGEWQELTWDFSAVADDGEYQTLTLIPNITEIPAEDRTYYIDDIVIGDASCQTSTSVFNTEVATLQVFPNPAREQLFINNPDELRELVLFNMLGQPVRRMVVENALQVRMDLSGLEQGMYLLNGFDQSGQLKANARIVKK